MEVFEFLLGGFIVWRLDKNIRKHAISPYIYKKKVSDEVTNDRIQLDKMTWDVYKELPADFNMSSFKQQDEYKRKVDNVSFKSIDKGEAAYRNITVYKNDKGEIYEKLRIAALLFRFLEL